MREKSNEYGFMGCVIRGTFTAIITTLIGILIFAGIVKIACLNTNVIKAVNQFIKVLSVFLGCFFSLKDKGGLIKGAIIGLVCAVVTYLLFSLIGAEISFGTTFLVDLLFQTVIGAIFGIITVNVRK